MQEHGGWLKQLKNKQDKSCRSSWVRTTKINWSCRQML
uniref:Uncharacterized protein n=1 Tax=Rhizophora mucronata TaxID=61149 RepID=A0A2P2IQ93_RHIMU